MSSRQAPNSPIDHLAAPRSWAQRSLVFVVESDAQRRAALLQTLGSAGLATRCWCDAETFLQQHGSERGAEAWCLVSAVRLPGMSGPDLQQRLRERQQQLPIVFVTDQADVATSVAALKCGAVDFLEMPCSDSVLLRSVEEALLQDRSQRQVESERAIVRARRARLTDREARVMTLVIAERTNKEIARELAISPRTVDHHREHVMAKMEAASIGELIVMGLLCGLKELRLHAAGHRHGTAPEWVRVPIDSAAASPLLCSGGGTWQSMPPPRSSLPLEGDS